MDRKTPSVTIVVPCYNEEHVFSSCVNALTEILGHLIASETISRDSHLLFVDDGSRDSTWQHITEATKRNPVPVRGLKLSRNCGHQVALIAGLSHVTSDISISIDADLQDDIQCIPTMIEKYRQGSDIVYGVRNDRSSDTFFKRFTANSFYKLMDAMGVQQIPNHADFRLLSRRALQALLAYKENMRYIRGIIPLLGYSVDQVFYKRAPRLAGTTKYPLSKMLNLCLEGITSLTITPLRLISIMGVATCILSGIAALIVISKALRGSTVPGWASIETSIFFLGGVQLLSLGILGEYIGRIYMESKRRPAYFIEEEV